MQNYGQQGQAGYQRPGSTTSFSGAPAPPPPYGTSQGYQSATPQTQSQWAPPQNQTPPLGQQWSQPQQGGYNPGVYGTMPGTYSQGQSAPNQTSIAYPPQHEVPPPPPPKPAGFAAAVQHQQNAQNLGQNHAYGAQQSQQDFQTAQQNTGYQGGYPQQGGYEGTPQQTYNNIAPPPPSQTPGGSYFPPSHTPQQPARPGSIYGANQAGTYSTPAPAAPQPPPSSVISPNEQQPAYIPPSLTGQGTQSYIPANTNPMPGVYVPPPPDIPAWQQAQHAPLQGGKKFKYTKPTVDPGAYGQGYQGSPVQQQQGQYGQQNQYVTQSPIQQQGQFGQLPPTQQQGQYGQTPQAQPAHQAQYGQTQPPAQYPQQTPQPYNQAPPSSQIPQQQQYQQSSQWQAPPADQGYGQQQQNVQTPYSGQQPIQQQGWQHGHQAQGSIPGHQYLQGQDAGIQAPKPVNGHTGTTPPGFVNQPSPQSQPVSPVNHRQSMSFSSAHNPTGLGRTGSLSSIALGAIHAQRAGNRTESPKPKPPPPKLPTPPPPRDSATKFSALGAGGPSDWEHFGAVEEIDDEELFGAKKEEKTNEKVQHASVELPAQVPSPVSSPGEISSPPNQTMGILRQEHDEYQPTPEQSRTPVQRPMSNPPQQSFIMGDAPPSHQPQQGFVMGDADAVPPTSTQSPHASQQTQHPPPQQGFVVSDGGWHPSKQGTPAQQQTQHQAPPTTQQGWGSQPVGSQQPQQPLPNNTFGMHDHAQGSSQPNYHHGGSAWGQQPNEAHCAELKEKDDAYERLKADMENERSGMRREIEELKVVLDTMKRHAESERNTMDEQIKTFKGAVEQAKGAAEQAKGVGESERKILEEQIARMRTTAEQGEMNTNALIKEKDSAIERWKEDAEGKDENVKAKEVVIAELGQQLKERDSVIEDLKIQLETERSKEPPKPTPADLVPDIDPWYASSLERYITMLRSEAHEPLVENKIKTFTAFLKAESGVRGLEYYNAPPAAEEPIQSPIDMPRKTSNASIKNKKALNVHVPEPVQSPDDDFQYSPGGRPILKRQATIPQTEIVPTNQTFNLPGGPSSHSTTIVTPTSSQDGSFNKTPTPIQSPPEEQPHRQYKAYVPPSITQEQSTNLLHRQSMSFGSPTPVSALQTPGSGHNDEIFFGGHTSQPSSNPTSRPATSAPMDIAVPPPLFTPKPPKAASPAPGIKKDPIGALTEILPVRIAASQPNPQLEKVRQKLSDVSSDFSFIQDLTTTWERNAALSRKKNDDARRKRQEESESHTDQLFNDNEISYAEIGAIEDEFKEKERELKAQEDKAEIESYGTHVFDKVFETLHSQIKTLTDIYIDAESLLHISVAGIKSLEGSDAATTQESLRLLQQVHEQIEFRHEKVAAAVAERDRRYKKTQIAPLYAAGNIAKMKAMEKHFEDAERQAVFRAKNERAEREGEFVHVVEEVVVGAVGLEKSEIERVGAAMRALSDGMYDEEVLKRARETLKALRESSKSLLSLFNSIEITLNAADGEAVIAQARAENATMDKIKELEKDIEDREIELREEFQRRIGVIDQDERESEGLLVGEQNAAPAIKGSEAEQEPLREEPPPITTKTVLSEEEEKKIRLQKALEAAKRRNGDL